MQAHLVVPTTDKAIRRDAEAACAIAGSTSMEQPSRSSAGQSCSQATDARSNGRSDGARGEAPGVEEAHQGKRQGEDEAGRQQGEVLATRPTAKRTSRTTPRMCRGPTCDQTAGQGAGEQAAADDSEQQMRHPRGDQTPRGPGVPQCIEQISDTEEMQPPARTLDAELAAGRGTGSSRA